ncbi:MAG: hypothetical protein STSR0009_24100 [Methanoregula sp.]
MDKPQSTRNLLLFVCGCLVGILVGTVSVSANRGVQYALDMQLPAPHYYTGIDFDTLKRTIT